MSRLFLVAFLLVACCSPAPQGGFSAYPGSDLKRDTKVVLETLEYWDRVVGYRRPFALIIDKQTIAGDALGQCRKGFGVRQLTIYAGKFPADRYEAALRTVLLHELAHVHMSCTNRDHSDNENSTLFPEIRELHSELTPDVIERLKKWDG